VTHDKHQKECQRHVADLLAKLKACVALPLAAFLQRRQLGTMRKMFGELESSSQLQLLAVPFFLEGPQRSDTINLRYMRLLYN
jgi:hypothetical protein